MIFQQLTQQIRSLSNLLSLLNDEQYNKQIKHLGKASIGGHTRHIIELLQCAIAGYNTGMIDYVNRTRNMNIQTNRFFAITNLELLEKQINLPNKQLEMKVEDIEDAVESTVPTTYFREVVYNTEHAIHHLALIKVALIEMKVDLVSDNFGMAYSTIKYKTSITSNV
jgi:hypothetical protein